MPEQRKILFYQSRPTKLIARRSLLQVLCIGLASIVLGMIVLKGGRRTEPQADPETQMNFEMTRLESAMLCYQANNNFDFCPNGLTLTELVNKLANDPETYSKYVRGMRYLGSGNDYWGRPLVVHYSNDGSDIIIWSMGPVGKNEKILWKVDSFYSPQGPPRPDTVKKSLQKKEPAQGSPK